MLRAFFTLSLLASLNAPDSAGMNAFVDENSWQAASLLEAPLVPVKDKSFVSPLIAAKAVLAVDLDSGEVLFEQNAHDLRSIASLTKVMTAIVVLEENDLEEVVTVSSSAAEVAGSEVYLRAGEKIRLEELLKALLISSANDASIALAEHNAGSVAAFVEKMNHKAKLMGLYNTSFSNPIGLDNIANYSTAHDVAVMGRYLYRKPFVEGVVGLKEDKIYSVDGSLSHNLLNTNKLLGNYLKIKGIKTGSTEEAGLCLLAIGANVDDRQVVAVVLDSPDRFQEMKILLDWIFRAYKW